MPPSRQSIFQVYLGFAAQRCALPAGGRDETTPFCRSQLQATQTARKRADSHQSGARCVGQRFDYSEADIIMAAKQHLPVSSDSLHIRQPTWFHHSGWEGNKLFQRRRKILLASQVAKQRPEFH